MKKTGPTESNNTESDEISPILFDARNFYHIGNFMSAINTVLPEQTTGSPDLLAYAYYSYLAIESGRLITSEIKDNNQTPLLAFRYLYDYLEKPEKRQEVVEFFQKRLQQDVGETNIWQMTSAIVFAQEGLYDSALKSLHGSNDLECMALQIQCLLKMNRLDLAKPILVKMQEKSDDATITQLAQAWINISIGTSDSLQDAYHIYQEMCEKYQPTPLLLNGQAVCHIGQERYEEAEAALKEALSKKHNDFDTLINLVVVSHLTGKSPEVLNRYIEQIKQFYPNSEFVKDYNQKEEEFDRLCEQYKPDMVV